MASVATASASIKPTTRSLAVSTRKGDLLRRDTINPRVLVAQYAVRGEIVLRAEKFRKQLESGSKLPFDKIVLCNIGNPQELGQKPITYFRQVISLLEYPDLEKSGLYPADVVERVKSWRARISGGMGAYSNSQGLPVIREAVARFTEDRDGYPCSPDNIFLTDGASPAVQSVINLLIRDSSDGILIPIPQYPLYSATIDSLGGTQIHYYLDEERQWSLKVDELRRSVNDARSKGIKPRALAVINPGNPTGQCMKEDNMKEVIQFCAEEGLVLLADEVYQENVYSSTKWHSFKSVLRSLGAAYDSFEMFSFNSISKGMLGECGHRGGYMEAIGISDEVKEQIYKLHSIRLCPNIVGQVMIGLMAARPKPGEPSYKLFAEEYDNIYQSLKRRAEKLVAALRKLEGVTCNSSEGAMYAFPQIRLPKNAVKAAKAAGIQPDMLYCLELLEATGICVVPGSGFGQADGTWHFRTTFLPGEEHIDEVVARMAKFHAEFLAKYH